MALVAYDNSDSSDYEENENEAIPIIISNKKESLQVEAESRGKLFTLQVTKDQESQKDVYALKHTEDGEQEATQNLFNHLPQPTLQKAALIEEEDEFLYKKETPPDIKPKSKITVPSLSDFKDVKDTVPIAKPKIINGKKSGLLSMLPQPKHSSIAMMTASKTLIPHVLTKKPQDPTAKKKAPHSVSSKKPKVQTRTSNNLTSQYSDDSDNDDIQNDFFAINKPIEVPIAEIPLDIDMPSSSKVRDAPNPKPRSIESYFKQDSVDSNIEEFPNEMETSSETYLAQAAQLNSNATTPTESGEIAIDDEAIFKLCGSRGKRKREEIQIVDVNQQEVLADARDWLLKGLMDDTSKRVSASKKRGNEPTSQQKRKHQITYLAHQAKANEIELQNQWANNRMTKRQTQSKYGF